MNGGTLRWANTACRELMTMTNDRMEPDAAMPGIQKELLAT